MLAARWGRQIGSTRASSPVWGVLVDVGNCESDPDRGGRVGPASARFRPPYDTTPQVTRRAMTDSEIICLLDACPPLQVAL